MGFATSTSSADGAGLATGNVSLGPLAAGARAQGFACAWSSVCTSLAVQGVAAKDWRIAVLSGADQSVASTASFGAVILQVTDLNGDPVAGVPVLIEQTLSNWEAPCADSGRCPPATILQSSQTSATSGLDGRVSIQGGEGGAGVTRLAVVAGTAGFATVTLVKHP